MRAVPYFLDTYPKTRRPEYSRQKGEIQTQVVIVGGGLTGCACAASFASAGVDVVLLEAERIGAGETARSAGLVRQDLDASFQESAALHGVRTARHVWQGFRRASLDFGAALRRLGIRSELAPQDLLTFTRDGAERARRLQRSTARRDAASRRRSTHEVAPRRHRAPAGPGKGDALDPYRTCVALAAAPRRARLHERTAVRIRAGARPSSPDRRRQSRRVPS